MTIFIIEQFSSYNNDFDEIVAVCDSYASAIQWLIENKGLTKDYTRFHPVYYQYWTLEDFYGKDWLKVLLSTQDIKYFHFDGLNYEIEEREIFSKNPLTFKGFYVIIKTMKGEIKMTCKECSAKEDCCFYRKKEENFPCVYETFKKDRERKESEK